MLSTHPILNIKLIDLCYELAITISYTLHFMFFNSILVLMKCRNPTHFSPDLIYDLWQDSPLISYTTRDKILTWSQIRLVTRLSTDLIYDSWQDPHLISNTTHDTTLTWSNVRLVAGICDIGSELQVMFFIWRGFGTKSKHSTWRKIIDQSFYSSSIQNTTLVFLLFGLSCLVRKVGLNLSDVILDPFIIIIIIIILASMLFRD